MNYPKFTIVPDGTYLTIEDQCLYACHEDNNFDSHKDYLFDVPHWNNVLPLEEPSDANLFKEFNHYVITESESKMYYLRKQNKYLGNGCVFWGKQSRGYTSDIKKAGKYSYKEALNKTQNSDESEAIPCFLIDYNFKSHINQIDSQYIDFCDERILKPRHGKK